MHRFYFEKLREVQTPTRSYENAAGWDFYIPSNFRFLKPQYLLNFQAHTNWESMTIPPQRALFVPSGLRIQMQKGWALRFENKSGIATRGLLVGATIVDQDYQGEVHLHLWNVSQNDVTIKSGQKILQGIFFETHDIELKESDELFSSPSARGKKGFGSSDKISKQ